MLRVHPGKHTDKGVSLWGGTALKPLHSKSESKEGATGLKTKISLVLLHCYMNMPLERSKEQWVSLLL